VNCPGTALSVKREAENNVEVKDELGTHEIRITKIRAQLEGGNGIKDVRE